MAILYPYESGDKAKIEALDKKVTNLSNIAVKNNIADQSLPQQRINQAPSNAEHIIRLNDVANWVQIVNHTTQLSANQVLTWVPSNFTLAPNTKYALIIVLPVDNIDYVFEWKLITGGNANYKYSGPVFTTTPADNLDSPIQCKIWFNTGKFTIFKNYVTNGCRVWIRKVL